MNAAPAGTSQDPPAMEDLGASLLDDLQLPPAAKREENAEPPAISEQPDALRLPKNLDRQLFKKFSDQQGEDIGQPSQQSPLVDIEAAMRNAQSLIAKAESVEQGALVQQQVVADLDALIEQLAKQCAACQNPSDAECENPGSRRSETAGSKPGTPKGKGTSAAQDSTARLDPGSAEAVDMAEMQELIKDLWGHLPARVREQLLQAPTDEFLPKYELEIEKYFRRLAEEGRQDASRP